MRRILAASILLSPLFLSAAVFASQPATTEPAATTTRPVSTGVTPAHVIFSHDVELSPAAAETLPVDAAVVLTLNVDEKGLPQNIQIVSSPSRYLDGPVADAVRQYRFRPATLNHQAVVAPMTLTVVVQR